MRKNVSEVIAWLDHQVKHPTQNWQHMCMSSARQAWGQAPWAPSARLAYARVPKNRLHRSLPKDVPAGAVCFGLLNTTYGHAWISAGNGMGYSVDYKRRGQIDKVPVNLPGWTKDPKVTWTDWSPFGDLPIHKPHH
jgi:hypothetical protein